MHLYVIIKASGQHVIGCVIKAHTHHLSDGGKCARNN